MYPVFPAHLKPINGKLHAFLNTLQLAGLRYKASVPKNVRAEGGIFFTPLSIAATMAKLAKVPTRFPVRILDPGAGFGILSASLITTILEHSIDAKTVSPEIHLTAIENDPTLVEYLDRYLLELESILSAHQIKFSYTIVSQDFVTWTLTHMEDQANALTEVSTPSNNSRDKESNKFDIVIANPPYRKLKADSPSNKLLQGVGIRAPNYYAAFLWLSLLLLKEGGQLIAITPRSFCNGRYFLPFRRFLADNFQLHAIYTFNSRLVFEKQGVLQEAIILKGERLAKKYQEANPKQPNLIKLAVLETKSGGNYPIFEAQVPYEKIFIRQQPYTIRIPESHNEVLLLSFAERLPNRIEDLDISASVGPVVEYRLKHLITKSKYASSLTVPLIRAKDLVRNKKSHPQVYLKASPNISNLLTPKGNYVLIKRVSAKEQPRRIEAHLIEDSDIDTEHFAIENHVIYIHSQKKGLDYALAKGLTAFLNSSFVDLMIRSISGSTQINVGDLLQLRWPTKRHLVVLGQKLNKAELFDVNLIDDILTQLLDWEEIRDK